MVNDEIVEIGAATLHEHISGKPWQQLDAEKKRRARETAKAALTAVAPMIREAALREAAALMKKKRRITVVGIDGTIASSAAKSAWRKGRYQTLKDAECAILALIPQTQEQNKYDESSPLTCSPGTYAKFLKW